MAAVPRAETVVLEAAFGKLWRIWQRREEEPRRGRRRE